MKMKRVGGSKRETSAAFCHFSAFDCKTFQCFNEKQERSNSLCLVWSFVFTWCCGLDSTAVRSFARGTMSRPDWAGTEAPYSCKVSRGNTAARFPSNHVYRKKKKIWYWESTGGFLDFAYRWVRLSKRCRRLGRTGPRRSALQPPAGRGRRRRRSEREAPCPRPDCLCLPSGLASDCREKPWRKGPRGRRQTCTHTFHQPPEKR